MSGNQLYAPEGWLSLRKDTKYFLIDKSRKSNRISLISFTDKNIPELNQLSRSDFEEGIKSSAILPCNQINSLPDWLREYEGLSIEVFQQDGKKSSKTDLMARVKERTHYISQTVERITEILNSDNPIAELNKDARSLTPPQNETRFRQWVFTYLAFSENQLSLLPKFNKCGRWDRFTSAKVKQGAPSLSLGKKFGFKMTKEMEEKCVQGFVKFAQNTRTLTSIYTETLKKVFGCRVERTAHKLFIVSSINYPTYNQFKYTIDKYYSAEERQRILYGQARYRTKKAKSIGRFSEELAHLGEKIYIDAYQIDARPKGYLHNETMPPLYGVTSSDGLSGMILGIGFSYGSERAEGYQALLFSMAINKKKFCSLFGIEINHEEWPAIGLPPHILLDRGPGSKLQNEDLDSVFIIREIAPSYSGQSKAPIETTHPKRVKLEGSPTFHASTLHPVQQATAEILRVLANISSADMSDRLDPSYDLINVYPTPNGIWSHYHSLFRNDLVQIPFEKAVRSFLTKVKFNVREDGIYLLSRKFTSPELRELGVLDSAVAIDGYVLEMCVRYVWIEWEGKLIELNAVLRIRSLDEDLFISYDELKSFHKSLSQKKSDLKIAKLAVNLESQQRYEHLIGHDYYESIKIRPGRIKKGASAKDESKDLFSGRNLKKAS